MGRREKMIGRWGDRGSSRPGYQEIRVWGKAVTRRNADREKSRIRIAKLNREDQGLSWHTASAQVQLMLASTNLHSCFVMKGEDYG